MPARAQSASGKSEPSPTTLEEIVVTADRPGSYSADFVQAGSFRGARQLDTPLTVNVIPHALIESQQAQSLLDALRNTAGVSPSQTSTTVYSNIAIRGINVENRGNYRLNGILPIVNLIDLPLEDKDRVEALKGASALYYGFTTPAGIINLTMKRPTPDAYAAVTLFGNEYGSLGGHIDAGDTWGPFGARINALYGSVDSGIDHTHGHRSLLAAAFDFKPSDSLTLSVDAEHILKRVNEPGVFRYIRLPTPTPANLYPALQLPPLLDPTTNFGPDWASNRAEERNLLASVNWKISPAWALSVSYGNSHLVRDRHFNTIDLNTYGPDHEWRRAARHRAATGCNVRQLQLSSRNRRRTECVVHETPVAARCLAEHSGRLQLGERSGHLSGRNAHGAALTVHSERVRSRGYPGNGIPRAHRHADAHQ